MPNELLTENFLHGRIEKITCQSKKIYLLRLKRLNIFTKSEAISIKEIGVYDKTPEQFIAQIMFNGDIEKVNGLLEDPVNTLEDVLSVKITDNMNRIGPQVIICVAYGGKKPYIIFASCSDKFITTPKFINYGIKPKICATYWRSRKVFERLCKDITITELYKNIKIKYKKKEITGLNITRTINGHIANTPIYEYKLIAPLRINKILKYIQEVLSNNKSYIDDNFKQLFPKEFYDAITFNDGVKLISDYDKMIKKYSFNRKYHIMQIKIYVYNGKIIDLKSMFSTEINMTNPLGKVVNS